MAIRFPKQNNPLWPLPPDYDRLDERGKWMARINACMLWNGESREDAIAAWTAFRSLYLAPPAVPLGLHYKQSYLPSPQFHFDMIGDNWEYSRIAVAAPRSSAKSTIVREMNLLDILTSPYREVVLFLAKQDFVTQQFDIYKALLETCHPLVDDWTSYWKTKTGANSLRPRRGEGSWSNSVLRLTNGAILTGMPIMGAVLGKRPHKLRFDDVERDDGLVKEPSSKIEAFSHFLYNVVDPMAEEGCQISIYGTLLSSRSFLYHLMTTDDPRIADFYHRVQLAVQMNDKELWQEKFSKEWQEETKARIGVAAFNTQFMNVPSTDHQFLLSVHPEGCSYEVENPDANLSQHPLNSQAVLVSHKYVGKDDDSKPIFRRITRPYGATVARMFRFMTVDSAPTVSPSSDFSCVHVMGYESSRDYRDVLWSLDLYLDKVRPDELVQRIYQIASKWQVRCVGVESYGLQMELYERLRENLPSMFGTGVIAPGVMPIKFPPSMEKADKIALMEWRFNTYAIKLPPPDYQYTSFRRSTRSPYSTLHEQINNFTMDMQMLPKDDAIDTLAMSARIGKPRSREEPDLLDNDPLKLLERGHRFNADGVPLFGLIDINQIPPSTMAKLRHQRHLQQVRELEETGGRIWIKG